MTDLYAVHVHLSRPDGDHSPASIMLTVEARRTDNPDDDQERAENYALDLLRPFLNNSVHLKALAVLL